MQFSLFKEIFGQPWHIEAGTFQQYLPLVSAILKGVPFISEKEPLENLPVKLRISFTDGVMAWDEENEDYSDETQEQESQPVIFVLKVRGVMMKNDMMCGPAGTRTLGNRLRQADSEKNVIGHIIIFETGGGSADSVPEIAEAIQACSKPVVAWVDGVMASAGMYAGSYCKEIIASRGTDLVGSIGTMMIWEGRTANSKENYEGVIHQRIYADDATEKNIEYEEAINKNNFKLVKERILNPHNLQFVNDIQKNRPGVEDKHLHGRFFYASDVMGSLVDSIGDFNSAIERVIALSKYKPNVTSNQSQSEKSTENVKHMKQFSYINQVLEVEELLSSEEGVYLNEEQLNTIDQRIKALQQAEHNYEAAIAESDASRTALEEANNTITSLTTQNEVNTEKLAELTTQVNTLEQDKTDLESRIALTDESINAIDETVANAGTIQEKVAAIGALLSLVPGATPPGTLTKGDKNKKADGVDWDLINSLPHNQEVDKNL
ncbi:MAG TPA: S49 family peptidase [Prolixibacteraceae bacterium]|nr:S49 family peptidase [Prolixibacteraceae bacterium]